MFLNILAKYVTEDRVYHPLYCIHMGNVICHTVANTLLYAIIWL